MNLTRKRKMSDAKLSLSPMIDVTFLLLIYFIVSIQMEPSLDDRLALPDARYAMKQEESSLQIYVLKAHLNQDGSINPDSTGLIAFADRAGTPDSCMYCGLSFKTKVNGIDIPDTTAWRTESYVINAKGRIVPGGVPEIVDTNTNEVIVGNEINRKEDVVIKDKVLEGRNKFCRRCGNNMLFVTLDMVPKALEQARDKLFEKIVAVENAKKLQEQKPPLTEEEIDKMKEDMPLMIKADAKTFYGRIIQVVERAREAKVTKFALVTSSESAWAQEHADLQAAYTKKLIEEGKIKEKGN
jgi:biopolymer transport protein ExbD